MKRMILLGLCCSLAAPALAADPARTVRATELKDKPYSDAQTVAKLPSGSTVEVLGRKASWMQIKHEKDSGWVKMLSLRIGEGNAKSGDSGLGALFNVAATGGSGHAVSTGVRGLSEEKLKHPTPNPDELAKLKRYQSSDSSARGYAKQGKLQAQKLDYLKGD